MYILIIKYTEWYIGNGESEGTDVFISENRDKLEDKIQEYKNRSNIIVWDDEISNIEDYKI